MTNSASQTQTQEFQQVRDLALAAFEGAQSPQELYEKKILYLGKSGKVNELMKQMGSLPPEARPLHGKLVNELKTELEIFYSQREEVLKVKALQDQMQNEALDLTQPGPVVEMGTHHPVYLVQDEIVRIMSHLGYRVRTGSLIEKDYYNFEALNIPANHPARDMQDTFFVDDQHVLRTHTSPIQIHSLESEELPLRIVGVGPVFRCDSDISHLPHFHQIEGMCVDRKVSMADLKGTISYFVREFFGEGLKTRFRPSFFPFTEPSAEVDCSCPKCKGKGCSLCKQTGWIEIGGSGLINPKVLAAAKVRYPDWQGFAFGFGLERMAIIKYGIEDIRLLPENNLRFLRQFVS